MQTLENIAIEVATRCGRLITDERPDEVGVADTKTSGTDVVTIMDRRAEALARDLLSELRPDDGLFGEEGLDVPSRSGITWVVDPIDGTVNYLYDIPAYAVSVAAVEGDPRVPGAWRPLAGAVVNPRIGELFHAYRGGGAHLRRGDRTTRLSVNPEVALGQTLLATGFSYESEKRAWQGRMIGELLPRVRDLRRIGSAALDVCNVACGRVDAYVEHNLHSWDIAAAWLIAAEAGATVRGLGVDYPSEAMIVVGQAGIVAELERFIVQWLAVDGRTLA